MSTSRASTASSNIPYPSRSSSTPPRAAGIRQNPGKRIPELFRTAFPAFFPAFLGRKQRCLPREKWEKIGFFREVWLCKRWGFVGCEGLGMEGLGRGCLDPDFPGRIPKSQEKPAQRAGILYPCGASRTFLVFLMAGSHPEHFLGIFFLFIFLGIFFFIF